MTFELKHSNWNLKPKFELHDEKYVHGTKNLFDLDDLSIYRRLSYTSSIVLKISASFLE